MRTGFSVSGIGLVLAGALLLGFAACQGAPTEPVESGEGQLSVEAASASPLFARGPTGKELPMVPLRIRERLEPAADAEPLTCAGGLQVENDRWTGSALVTHLGRTKVDLRVTRCTTEQVQAGENLHLWTGEFTAVYTAANGDDLWIAGVLRSYVPERIEVDLVITGGTGRFAGATGWAAGVGYREGVPGTRIAYNEAHGEMSRPNASR